MVSLILLSINKWLVQLPENMFFYILINKWTADSTYGLVAIILMEHQLMQYILFWQIRGIFMQQSKHLLQNVSESQVSLQLKHMQYVQFTHQPQPLIISFQS